MGVVVGGGGRERGREREKQRETLHPVIRPSTAQMPLWLVLGQAEART